MFRVQGTEPPAATHQLPVPNLRLRLFRCVVDPCNAGGEDRDTKIQTNSLRTSFDWAQHGAKATSVNKPRFLKAS